MRPRLEPRQVRALATLGAVLLLAAAPARGATPDRRTTLHDSVKPAIAESTRVDHDGRPIPRPPDWEPSYWGQMTRHGLVAPVSHLFDIPDKLLWGARQFGARTKREAVNVNAFDEVPNSSWFTNRNHRRAIPLSQMRQGPDSVYAPAKPWTIKHRKKHGWTAGFQIEDANGVKWLVKLDPQGYPQIGSGADVVARTLIHAAGYNVPHNTPVRFRRSDLTMDADLVRGTKGEHFSEAELDSLLARGATYPDGSYAAFASLFLPGHVLGAPSMDRKRPGDRNDWYTHRNRREIRGLYVLFAWINSWDTKDHQWLDVFAETSDSLGHVKHYILDLGASLGAAARGPKSLQAGYEHKIDFNWTARRIATLGFVVEPWRRAHQDSGIPSVGRFESDVFDAQNFKPQMQQPAFRLMTHRDGYWGAKIVASFSDAQIAAAVDAAQYEDPRAKEYLVRHLIVRRDKIAKYWFDRVAPLDFFHADDRSLRFRDLAVDVGLEGARTYEVEMAGDGRGSRKIVRLSTPELPLTELGAGTVSSPISLSISVAGSSAKATHVELTRKDRAWVVTRVRHG